MPRKNSKERALSFEIKDRRSYSIGSNGSIETIDLDDDSFNKPINENKKRRKREINMEDNKRRNTPDIITIKKLIEKFRQVFINK